MYGVKAACARSCTWTRCGFGRRPGSIRRRGPDRLGSSLRGLFLIAARWPTTFSVREEREGAALVAATGMGGGLGSLRDVPEDFFPGDGSVAGLVKTLAREWEGVLVEGR